MPKFRTRGAAAAALVASLTLVLASCNSAAQPSAVNKNCKNSTSISVATTPYEDSMLMQIGQALGWYANACISIEFKNVQYGSVMQTLAAGTTNVAWYTTSGVATTYHLDGDVRYFYPWDIVSDGNALMGRADGLKSKDDFVKEGMSNDQAIAAVVNELHGRNVITTKSNVREELLVAALNQQGKNLDWVNETNLDAAAGLATFLRGTGDAYISGIPQRQTLIDQGYKVLLSGHDLAPASLNGFLTTQKFYTEHKDALLALQHIMFMTMRYADAHKQEVAKYIADNYNHATGSHITPEQFLDDYQGLELYPRTASEAASLTLNEGSKYDWRAEWALDNQYLFGLTHTIPAPVPDNAFLGMDFQQAYVQKYGADEQGWDNPTGSLN